MMVIGIGTDIIEVDRISRALYRPAFLTKVFTEKEKNYFALRKQNPQVIAGNFAAKEAVVKALATGFRGFSWTDVEVLRDELGKPYVILHNNAGERMKLMKGKKLHVSISHTREYAVAQAVIEGE